MQELNKVLEGWIEGKIRTVTSPHWTASVKHKDQIHKLEEDSHFAFCDIQRIETRLDRLEAFGEESIMLRELDEEMGELAD